MALSNIHTVKEAAVTLLCFSLCWCSTMPRLWGIAQIFLCNPPGISASWSLIFDRAGFLQAFWVVILHGPFGSDIHFPLFTLPIDELIWSYLLLAGSASCSVTLHSFIWLLKWKLGSARRQKQSHTSSTKTWHSPPSFEKCRKRKRTLCLQGAQPDPALFIDAPRLHQYADPSALLRYLHGTDRQWGNTFINRITSSFPFPLSPLFRNPHWWTYFTAESCQFHPTFIPALMAPNTFFFAL